MKYRLFILFGYLLSSPALLAQDNWELKKNEKGIAVYSRNLTNETYKQIKVICELPGTTDNLIKTIRDVAHYKDWAYLNRKTELLKKKTDNNFIYHTETDMPWPLTDRDMVIETTILPDKENDLLRIEVKSIPDYVPQKVNLVRIQYSLAVWEVKPLPNNKLKVEYTLSVDPGGSVPAWLVNATVATGPYNTFVKLREKLASQ